MKGDFTIKNFNIRYIAIRLGLLGLSIFLFGITASAQIGPSPNATNTPNYGIYGSAPTPAGTPFTCGDARYAKLELYPDPTQGEGLVSWSQTVPLNGLKNFNFYYTSDGIGFLSGGGYRVTYQNASHVNCYGLIGDIVTYSPNRAHTNGVQVRPFNGNLPSPLGIHGYVFVKIPGGDGATAPLENAIVSVGETAVFFPYKAKTNGVGFFSIYYSSQTPGEFLPPDNNYYFKISGVFNNCSFNYDGFAIWLPYYGPGDPQHYVTFANEDQGTILLESTVQGCQP